jgi:hypothetical protein
MHRYITQKQKIIDALRDAFPDGVTNAELNKISFRFGGHIGTLRKEGYRIKTIELDGGLTKYFWISEPSKTDTFQNAQEQILADIYIGYDDSISSEELKGLLDARHFHIIRKNGWYEKHYGAENQMPIN